MISTEFSKRLNLRAPIIMAPMFLVSDVPMTVAAAKAGILGVVPSLNWRTHQDFRKALREIRTQIGSKPFGVNLIVNASNLRWKEDLKACLDEGVNFYITSLGNPKQVIEGAHQTNALVYCDVVGLEHARKVEDLGADGLIAVSSGAGGHAGPTSPLVLIPYLRKRSKLPIIQAGGVADGVSMAGSLTLGASGVQIGTRFIASLEAPVDEAYKKAIVEAEPDDIVMTTRISGTPAAVIKTPYIEKIGLDLNPLEKFLLKKDLTKKWTKLLVSLRGAQLLQKAASKTTWKEVWSAGQSVGLIEEIEPIQKIVDTMIKECEDSIKKSFSLIS